VRCSDFFGQEDNLLGKIALLGKAGFSYVNLLDRTLTITPVDGIFCGSFFIMTVCFQDFTRGEGWG
jgi:hypothetical protein